MELDHLPGFVRLGGALKFTTEGALAEMQKCEWVCANCHRVRTYERKHGVAHDGARRPDLVVWTRFGVQDELAPLYEIQALLA